MKKVGSTRLGAHYNPNNIDPRELAPEGDTTAGVATNYGMPKV